MRCFRQGEGWLPLESIESATGAVALDTHLAFATTGEAMALCVRGEAFCYSRFGPG
jgi:hypothetical protein